MSLGAQQWHVGPDGEDNICRKVPGKTIYKGDVKVLGGRRRNYNSLDIIIEFHLLVSLIIIPSLLINNGVQFSHEMLAPHAPSPQPVINNPRRHKPLLA